MREGGFGRLRISSVLAALALLGAGPLLAQATRPAPDAEFAPAKAAFEALGVDARKSIQRDLIWMGGLEASATGEFGALTYAAIRRFETAAKLKLDGILSDSERSNLASAAEKARLEAGFRIENDAASKMRIGIPGKLLVRRSENSSGGGRWQDKDEKVTLDLQVLKPDEQLSALFEKGTAASVVGRKITYKLLRPDFFVISGETAAGKFYRRVEKGADGTLRGFSLGYDKALAPQLDKQIIAIAASFEAFPGKTALPGGVSTVAAAALSVKPSRNRLTALFVGADSLISSESAFRACKGAMLASGSRSAVTLVKADTASGLALLRASGNSSVILHAGENGAQVLLLQRTIEGEMAASSALIADNSVQASVQEGGAGAPLFERSGALVGIIVAEPVQKFAIAGTLPLMRYRFANAQAIARLTGLVPVVVAPGADLQSAGRIAAERESSVVSILCSA